jgi:peptide/nickel transport system substrate-binding protein
MIGNPLRHGVRVALTMATAAVLLASVAACAGTTKSSGVSPAGGKTLTLGMAAAPSSLDPGIYNTATDWFYELAYETPFILDSSGKVTAGLAVKWGYKGTGNTVFDLTLRSGVKFSDGTSLTAQAMKDSILHSAAYPGGGAKSRWTGKTITVTGPLSLEITSATPDPLIVRELTQTIPGGFAISPTALKNPAALGTTTDGTGPYVLDPNTTVVGDHYTFTANPNYWNKSVQHYKTVVIKIIPTPTGVLDALETGQIDAAPGDYTTAAAATTAKLNVSAVDVAFYGLILADRQGTEVKALGDVRVRQAINYAIDRAKITKGLFGTSAVPTESIVFPKPGSEGAPSKPHYTYDPAKAKKLLAEAGYSSGIVIPTLTSTYASQNQVTEAIAADLAKVGITLKLTVDATQPQYMADLESGKFPVVSIGYGVLPLYILGPQLFLPTHGTYNPFNSDDPTLDSLFTQANVETGEAQAATYKKIVARLTEQGWFALSTLAPRYYFSRTTVTGLDRTQAAPQVYVLNIKPSGK